MVAQSHNCFFSLHTQHHEVDFQVSKKKEDHNKST